MVWCRCMNIFVKWFHKISNPDILLLYFADIKIGKTFLLGLILKEWKVWCLEILQFSLLWNLMNWKTVKIRCGNTEFVSQYQFAKNLSLYLQADTSFGTIVCHEDTWWLIQQVKCKNWKLVEYFITEQKELMRNIKKYITPQVLHKLKKISEVLNFSEHSVLKMLSTLISIHHLRNIPSVSVINSPSSGEKIS